MPLVRGVTFKNLDPRDLPVYSPTEAAHYLRTPLSTLRTWIFGYYPQTKRSGRQVPPIIRVPSTHARLLSFNNLVEAHVLSSIKTEHKVPLPKIRKAVRYVEEKLGTPRPLASKKFETDGIDLFIRSLGQLINASSEGQVAFEKILQTYLKRIDWDEKGFAMRLFPNVWHGISTGAQPKVVSMDSSISAGRPVLSGTGIVTKVVAERYLSGETVEALANDYGRDSKDIDEVLRFELRAA